MPDAPLLELRLLGTVEARKPDGKAVANLSRQSKRLALLAHLALEPGWHRRESLLALLWPDLPEAAGRRALRQVLHFLRHSLDETIFSKRGADELGIDPDRLWCDATALRAAFAEEDYATVAELYRGELLHGFHPDGVASRFEFALEDARRDLREKALLALRERARARREAGELDEAVALARRALEIHPSDEIVLRDLVALHDRRGDRARAVETYERFASRLARDLGVEPSAETREAVRRVRERERPFKDRGEAGVFPGRPPRPLTSFVGRERILGTARRLLGHDDVRLLSLVGPAGVGKSRLALELAGRLEEEYADGLAWAGLDAATEPDRALAEIARAVRAGARDDRRTGPAIGERLAGRSALLLLDGLDRVPGLGPELAALLADAPEVDLLVTCRAPLGLEIEQTLPVPPLSLPDPERWLGVELPLDSEATALFLDRARAADPAFRLAPETVEAVISIVRRLDGLPLAIELAAARLRHFPIHELARRIEGQLELLKHPGADRPARHRTLEAAIRGSDELLDAEERALFHGLGAFAGEFGPEAARAISPDGGEDGRPLVERLSALVDHGLVERPRLIDGELRYRMLRTNRDYAARRLAEEERAEELRHRMARHYAEWTRDGTRHWCTNSESAWIRRLDREYPNLQVTLEWASRHDVGCAAAIASAIHHYWWVRGLATEGRRRIEAVLDGGAEDATPDQRGRLMVAIGTLLALQGEFDVAIERMRRGAAEYRDAGDTGGLGWAWQCLSNALLHGGRLEAAEDAAGRALEIGRKTDDPVRVRVGLRSLAEIALVRGDVDRAEALLEETLALEASPTEEAWMLELRIEIAVRRGESRRAEALCLQLISLAEAERQRSKLAHAHATLADVLRDRGSGGDEIRRLYGRALATYREIGETPGILSVLVAIAETVAEAGEARAAARMLAAIEARTADEGIREPRLVERLERALEGSKLRIGAAAFERERAEGRALSLERLLARAEDVVASPKIPLAAP